MNLKTIQQRVRKGNWGLPFLNALVEQLYRLPIRPRRHFAAQFRRKSASKHARKMEFPKRSFFRNIEGRRHLFVTRVQRKALRVGRWRL